MEPSLAVFLDDKDVLMKVKLSPLVDRQRSSINHHAKQLKAENKPTLIFANDSRGDYSDNSFELESVFCKPVESPH